MGMRREVCADAIGEIRLLQLDCAHIHADGKLETLRPATIPFA